MMLLICGVIVIFLAGVQIWKFMLAGTLGAACLPILWHLLYDYQKNRILVFLNPESDPMRSGYHVMQSKIALGSGGFLGKGYMQGSQAHLNFLPEKQTDFIFTMFCEEFGMLGALVLITFYAIIIMHCYTIAIRSRSSFAKLMTIGLVSILFFYMFINMAMDMGLVPVVGVPLPLVSYGGTSMLTVLFSLGLIFSARIFHDTRLGSA
jgi:rod shape determining protein RodA